MEYLKYDANRAEISLYFENRKLRESYELQGRQGQVIYGVLSNF